MILKTENEHFIYYSLPDGRKHNINDEPAIVWKDGSLEWWKEGLLHRENGPSMIHQIPDSNCPFYYRYHQKGFLHRLDGPAIIEYKRTEWWFNGHNVDNFIFQWFFEIGIDHKNLSDEDKSMIYMKWHDYGR